MPDNFVVCKEEKEKTVFKTWILKLAADTLMRVFLPMLREYVKSTPTPLDDAALDAIENVIGSSGFASYAEANAMKYTVES